MDVSLDIPSRTAVIYGLEDPCGATCYIGQVEEASEESMTNRLAAHWQTPVGTPIKMAWINGLKEHGLPPLMRVLDLVPRDEAHACEKRYIVRYVTQGEPLTNSQYNPYYTLMWGGFSGITITAAEMLDMQRSIPKPPLTALTRSVAAMQLREDLRQRLRIVAVRRHFKLYDALEEAVELYLAQQEKQEAPLSTPVSGARGIAVSPDLVDRLKIVAIKKKRKLYEVMDEAMTQYLQREEG